MELCQYHLNVELEGGGREMKRTRWSLAVEISSAELASFCASVAFDGGDTELPQVSADDAVNPTPFSKVF